MKKDPLYAYKILYEVIKPWYSTPCTKLGNPFNKKDPSKVTLYVEETISSSTYPIKIKDIEVSLYK